MSILERYLDEINAKDLGIPPESITLEFIHEMRKKEQADEMYPLIGEFSSEQQQRWNNKRRIWAREVLRQGPTSCTSN